MRTLAALAAVAAALALGACGGSDEPSAAPATTTAPPATTTATPEPAPVVIRLEDGEPVDGEATIEVAKGDTVRLEIESDVEDEIHVHGYDLEQSVAPGAPATFTFTAELEGIFEIEGHESGAVIAQLVVEP